MCKISIVTDTNVLISALGWNGSERKIYKLCISGKFDLYLSEPILAELKRVLDYPKFKFSEDEKSMILHNLRQTAKIIARDWGSCIKRRVIIKNR